ncbi:MAG: ParA family protein [Blautia sp.]|nr:ParA family protein [Blautia sp.]
MAKVIAVVNQKGGCSKTTVVANLGVGLSRNGKKVCVIDADPQGSLTASLGLCEEDANWNDSSHGNPIVEDTRQTLATVMMDIINEDSYDPMACILRHEEGIDLVPANIELSGLEVSLANVMSREMILKEYVDQLRDSYDYILIDCMPSLGVMTINALVAADKVLVPVQAAYLPVKGLQQLIKTVSVVKKRLNKKLSMMGILITMVDYRTNYAKDITQLLRDTYGNSVGVMDTYIPFSVKVAEASAEGESVFKYAPGCKAAEGFKKLTEEVLVG